MWFTEDPWYPLLGCVLVFLALIGLWRTNPKPVYMQAMFGVVVLGALIVFVERMVVTPSEQIDDNIHDLVDSFRRQDLDRTFSHISESATNERMLISGAIGIVDLDEDLRITDMDVKVLDGGTSAKARFRVNATADAVGSSYRVRTRWELSFQREGDDWKVTRIQRMKLLEDGFIEPINSVSET